MSTRMLVVAKAPVAGRVKTRLGADIGLDEAAAVAAAALVDSLVACRDAVGPGRCALALDGDLAEAVRGDELTRLVAGWTVYPQHGDGLAERLVRAHLGVPAGAGPVVQIGMDTPQVTPELLLDAASAADGRDAALGPAEDGGWWVLTLHDPSHARLLRGVEMSTDSTHDVTRRVLESAGLSVGSTATLRDVDTLADADLVASAAPGSHFARAWSRVSQVDGARR